MMIHDLKTMQLTNSERECIIYSVRSTMHRFMNIRHEHIRHGGVPMWLTRLDLTGAGKFIRLNSLYIEYKTTDLDLPLPLRALLSSDIEPLVQELIYNDSRH